MEKQIAVVSALHGVGEKTVLGVANFFNSVNGWSIRPFSWTEWMLRKNDDGEQFQGVILIDAESSYRDHLNLSVPTVSVSGENLNPTDGVASVAVDDSEIGLMAAQHLSGKGFKNYAFVGGIEPLSSRLRYESFKNYLSEQNVNIHLFSEAPAGDSHRFGPRNDMSDLFRRRLHAWLQSLPKPIGVFAVDDWNAFEIDLACRSLDIEIPNHIALLGVNDDDLACQICVPKLTSIRLPFEKVGYHAGEMLHRLIQGHEVSNEIMKPIGLVIRESTNTFAVEDKIVREALYYMQKEAQNPIRVEEILKHVGVSRSLLERRFRGEMGRTPLVEMRRQRVERARGLLADTELAINQIASLCGFASNIRFTTVFREQVGITPTEFRNQMQRAK